MMWLIFKTLINLCVLFSFAQSEIDNQVTKYDIVQLKIETPFFTPSGEVVYKGTYLDRNTNNHYSAVVSYDGQDSRLNIYLDHQVYDGPMNMKLQIESNSKEGKAVTEKFMKGIEWASNNIVVRGPSDLPGFSYPDRKAKLDKDRTSFLLLNGDGEPLSKKEREELNLDQFLYTGSNVQNNYGPSPMDPYESMRIQNELSQGLNNYLNRFSADIAQDIAQQQQKRGAQLYQRNKVLNKMDKQRAEIRSDIGNQRQHLANLVGQLVNTVSGNSAEGLKGQEISNTFELTAEGVEYYQKQVIEAYTSGGAFALASAATSLYGAQNSPKSVAGNGLDRKGYLKGRVLKENGLGVPPNSINKDVRGLVNKIQATASEDLFLGEIEHTRLGAQATILKVKLATLSGNHEMVRDAYDQFDLLSRKTKFEIQQDVIESLAKNPYWLSDGATQLTLVDRPYGKAIDVKKSMESFVDSTINDQREEWRDLENQVPVNINGELSFETPQVQGAYNEIKTIEKGYYKNSQDLLDHSVASLEIADAEYLGGNSLSGEQWLGIAAQFADIAIGFIPIANSFNDAYALFVGRSLMTGEELTMVDRGFALVGLATLGLGSSIGKTVKVIDKLGDCCFNSFSTKIADNAKLIVSEVNKVGIKTADQLAGYTKMVGKSGVSAIQKADDLIKHTKAIGGDSVNALTRVSAELASKMKLTPRLEKYMAKQVWHSPRILEAGHKLGAEDLRRVSQQFNKLSSNMGADLGKHMDVEGYRAIPATYDDGAGNLLQLSKNNVFQNHSGMAGANGRMGMPGRVVGYAVVGPENVAKNIAFKEVLAHNPSATDVIYDSRKFKLDNVLDLTDKKVRDVLELPETWMVGVEKNNYEITHMISELAWEKGYSAIKFQSVRSDVMNDVDKAIEVANIAILGGF